MTRNLKLSLGLVAAFLVAIGFAVLVSGDGDDEPASAAQTAATTTPTATAALAQRVVASDPRTLGRKGSSGVTFTEFLDFECEACGAAYPAIEQLREDYGDRVTFVVRYMPLHNNSEAATRAAEAAAAQGKFEEMYDRLFQTQAQWGERDTSQEEVFFGYAEDLGLDMDRFRQVYDDPATIERVRRDKADGEALGVAGTPTFFVNGEKLEIKNFDDLVKALDDALAG